MKRFRAIAETFFAGAAAPLITNYSLLIPNYFLPKIKGVFL